MTIDVSLPDNVQILMEDYIQSVLDGLPNDMDGDSPTTAPNHHFEVNNDDPTPLDTETADMFHHNVAQLLFLCKPARPDIQTALVF
jgi:hypothetical protein